MQLLTHCSVCLPSTLEWEGDMNIVQWKLRISLFERMKIVHNTWLMLRELQTGKVDCMKYKDWSHWKCLKQKPPVAHFPCSYVFISIKASHFAKIYRSFLFFCYYQSCFKYLVQGYPYGYEHNKQPSQNIDKKNKKILYTKVGNHINNWSQHWSRIGCIRQRRWTTTTSYIFCHR